MTASQRSPEAARTPRQIDQPSGLSGRNLGQAAVQTNSAKGLPYRVFSTTGQWYFDLPQGARCGPYASQIQADVEAGLLWQQLLANPADASSVIQTFCLDSEVTCRFIR